MNLKPPLFKTYRSASSSVAAYRSMLIAARRTHTAVKTLGIDRHVIGPAPEGASVAVADAELSSELLVEVVEATSVAAVEVEGRSETMTTEVTVGFGAGVLEEVVAVVVSETVKAVVSDMMIEGTALDTELGV